MKRLALLALILLTPVARAEEPAKAEESTQRNLAVATHPAAPGLPGDGGGTDGARLKFLSGHKAGQAVALTRDRTTIGRAGVQLVAVERSGEGYRLRVVEGTPTPVNGQPATADGVPLATGLFSRGVSMSRGSSNPVSQKGALRPAEIAQR